MRGLVDTNTAQRHIAINKKQINFIYASLSTAHCDVLILWCEGKEVYILYIDENYLVAWVTSSLCSFIRVSPFRLATVYNSIRRLWSVCHVLSDVSGYKWTRCHFFCLPLNRLKPDEIWVKKMNFPCDSLLYSIAYKYLADNNSDDDDDDDNDTWR